MHGCASLANWQYLFLNNTLVQLHRALQAELFWSLRKKLGWLGYLYVVLSGESTNAIPHYHKLRTRVTHIWGYRSGQPIRCAMDRPHTGETSIVTKVFPVPGKYAYKQLLCKLVSASVCDSPVFMTGQPGKHLLYLLPLSRMYLVCPPLYDTHHSRMIFVVIMKQKWQHLRPPRIILSNFK